MKRPVYHAYRDLDREGYVRLWCRRATTEDDYWDLAHATCPTCVAYGALVMSRGQLALVAEGARGRAAAE